MLDVVEIVAKLLLRFFERGTVLVADLRPAGNTRAYDVAQAVERDFPAKPLDEFRALGPRPGEGHVPLDYIQELRDFVQARIAKEAAHARDTRIVVPRPGGAGVGFRIRAHGPEFIAVENSAELADALLPVNHRAGRAQLDG